MIREVARVAVDGVAQDDLVDDLQVLEVSEDVAAATVFRLRLAARAGPSGAWPRLAERRLQPWRRVTVDVGYPPDAARLVDGYVTHVEAHLATTGDGTVDVSGLDRSAALDLEDRQTSWPNLTDDQVATRVFGAYGLRAVTEPTPQPATDRVSTTLQSESDMRFLRRLADRNGFECFVRGDTGYFRPPNLSEPPQKELALAFGAQTTLVEATVRVDATAAVRVDARRVDPFTGAVEARSLGTGPWRSLARDDLAAAMSSGGVTGRRFLRGAAAPSASALDARLRAAYRPADGFVRMEGRVDSRQYLAVLRPGRLVPVKGLGERYSGLYYVLRVDHTLTPEGFDQRFTARRNGTGLTGEERFGSAAGSGAAGSGATGVPAASGASGGGPR